MLKSRILAAAGASTVLTIAMAPAAAAFTSHIDSAATGFESRRWDSVGGSSTVNFQKCSSVGLGPEQNTTHISQWLDKFGPDTKYGASARLSACFKNKTSWSSTTRSISPGKSTYFKIEKINGEVAGSALDVKAVNVSE